MSQKTFLETLNKETDFTLRRAVERLREGLFDPTAVRLLTEHESMLTAELEKKFKAIDSGRSAHWCICGAYGQGKSHSLTYIRDYASRNNFVTSTINLDIRELPFHNIKAVYRSLLNNLRFPDSEESLAARWKKWSKEQLSKQANTEVEQTVRNLLPEKMPHRFKSIMTAIAQKNLPLTDRQKQAKKHAAFRPKEFPYILSKALSGEDIPFNKVRAAVKYRQVSFYREGSLTCKGVEPYLEMIAALGALFQKMGYRGWVIQFDEGEAIAQMPVSIRNKSYEILDHFFLPDTMPGVLPVFGFTNDFFQKMESEEYERVKVVNEEEEPYFKKDYAAAWQKVRKLQLQDLSKKEWQDLIDKLIQIHTRAYRWNQPEKELSKSLEQRLNASKNQETRYKLKALVDELDLHHQELLLN